jgi:thiol-disulfide isomerase/thioredoxin
MKKILLPLIIVLGTISAQAQVQREVLIEEFTGTWCVNCPDGHNILKQIETANPDKVNVVGMHNADQFTIPYEVAIENAFVVGGFPRAAIDRATYSGGNAFVMSRGFWAAATAARLNITSPIEMNILPSYDKQNRVLTVNVDYTFKADVNQETRLTCVLLEDSIIASQTGGSANYMHFDVCRALLSADNWGDANHPATVTSNSSYNKTYTYTVPNTFNDKNLRVVAFLNKKIGTPPVVSTGTEVLQSHGSKIYNSPLNVASTNITKNDFSVAPNPFSEITSIKFNLAKDATVKAFITNLSGQVVEQLNNEQLSLGNHSIFWSGSSNGQQVPQGIYFFNINVDGQNFSKPVLFKN